MTSPSQRARTVFAEWLAKTGDVRIAAERAGVSERTGRRWKNEGPNISSDPSSPRMPAPVQNAEPTKFVGRKAALIRASPKCFPGGCTPVVDALGHRRAGKTRLSLRYADLNASTYPGGVLFCDVSGAKSVEEVCAAVARALGVTLPSRASDTERAEQLGHALDNRGTMLLVLDNFEQAVTAAPATVGTWTTLARRAHVIVTSRVQLRVLGEACFWLEALELPSEGASAAGSEAVQLFVDPRAARASGFRARLERLCGRGDRSRAQARRERARHRARRGARVDLVARAAPRRVLRNDSTCSRAVRAMQRPDKHRCASRSINLGSFSTTRAGACSRRHRFFAEGSRLTPLEEVIKTKSESEVVLDALEALRQNSLSLHVRHAEAARCASKCTRAFATTRPSIFATWITPTRPRGASQNISSTKQMRPTPTI